jgi:hypothetical protein
MAIHITLKMFLKKKKKKDVSKANDVGQVATGPS